MSSALIHQQKEIGSRLHGKLYIDHQPDNMRDFRHIVEALATVYQASKTSVIYRLKNLGLVNGPGYRFADFDDRPSEAGRIEFPARLRLLGFEEVGGADLQ